LLAAATKLLCLLLPAAACEELAKGLTKLCLRRGLGCPRFGLGFQVWCSPRHVSEASFGEASLEEASLERANL
jgi:hypothetical protein